MPASFIVGAASDFLSDGIGVSGFFGRRATGPLWIRTDLFHLWLRGDSSGAEEADNALLSFGIGPEVQVGPEAVRLYVRGAVGSIGDLQSRRGSSLQAETSWAALYGGGLGVRLRLAGGSRPVALDLGGDVLKTGELALATVSDAGGVSDAELGMIILRAALVVDLP